MHLYVFNNKKKISCSDQLNVGFSERSGSRDRSVWTTKDLLIIWIDWSFGSTDHLAWTKDDQLNVWIDWSFGSTKRSANPFDWVILLWEVKKRADHWHQWIIWFNQTTRLDFWVDWTFGSTKPRPADHWNRLILFKQKRSKDFSTNRSDLLFQFELKKISKFSESTDVLTTHDLLIDHKPQRGSTDCLARPIASDRLISECWVEQKWIG